MELIWEGDKPGVLHYTAISMKVVGKNVHATILKGDMGYDQYTVPDTVPVALLLLLSSSSRKHKSVASSAILVNFFGEQWTQNQPQLCVSLTRPASMQI